MKSLRILSRGDLPIADACWTSTVTIGLAVSMFSTIRVPARLIPDLPWLALTAGCAVSVSSNIVAVVGVLRLPSAIWGRA